jgi:hypothetical protein
LACVRVAVGLAYVCVAAGLVCVRVACMRMAVGLGYVCVVVVGVRARARDARVCAWVGLGWVREEGSCA